MALVYKVTSPSNKVYIGITSQDFLQRIRDLKLNRSHINECLWGNRKSTGGYYFQALGGDL